MGQALIKIHYYIPYVSKILKEGKSKKEVVVPAKQFLDSLFTTANKTPVMERTKPKSSVYNEIRLQVVEKEEDFWYGQFVKVRDDVAPGLVTAKGEYRHIDLESGEYIGEDTSFLYDVKNNILAFQRNYYSVSDKRAAEYFKYIFDINSAEDKYEYNISFRPCINSSSIELSDVALKSFDITCIDVGNPCLKTVLGNVRTHGAKSITVHYGLGKGRDNASLAKKKINDFLKLAIYDSDFTKIKGRIKEDPNSPVTEIDFLERRIETKFTLDYSLDNLINHQRIREAMKLHYPKGLERIKRIEQS